MNLGTVLKLELKTYEGRLEWARYLLSQLDSAARIDLPLQPYDLRGVDEKEIHRLRVKFAPTESDRDTLLRWTAWRQSVAHASRRNELNFWSLLRMVQIFDEQSDTRGEAETVRRFLAEYWWETT
jgi:hypothetical protein